MKVPRSLAGGLRNAVVCADALRHPTVGLPARPDKSVDHSILDSPYGERTHAKRWSGAGGDRRIRGYATPKSNPVTFQHWTPEDVRLASRQLVRVTRGWIVAFSDEDLLPAWKRSLVDAGAERRVTCIWTKPNGTPQFHGDGPAQPGEYIVTAWCGERGSTWNGGGKRGHYDVTIETAELRRHETQKPLALMRALVLDFTRPGDLILDICAGGGQTGVAAKLLGRDYLLYEIDEAVAATARAAIAGTREQLSLHEALHRARPGAFGRAAQAAAKQGALW